LEGGEELLDLFRLFEAVVGRLRKRKSEEGGRERLVR